MNTYLVMVSGGNDPRRRRRASAKIFTLLSAVGKPAICQLVSAGNLRKTIFDTFLLWYPNVSIVRPSRDLLLCDYGTETNYEKINEYKPYRARVHTMTLTISELPTSGTL